jgi:tetratricopeptide (TPR) repeat protein
VPARTKVFISYSSSDRHWVDRLRIHLKQLERDRGIEIWEDSELEAGSRWQQSIAKELAVTKVAILLVSADFIASDFIATNELPHLLAAAKEERAVILPVIVSASSYLSIPELAAFEAVNDPKQPLIKLTKDQQEDVLANVRKAVEAAFGGAVDNAGQQVASSAPGLSQLRDPVGDFVGREEEIDRIVTALSRVQATDAAGAIVVVRGMGGVGKTELAYKVATRLESQFPDGHLLIELGGETPTPLSAEQALRSIIRNFVPAETSKKADTPAKLQALYETTLAGKRYFILADNAKGADQVRPLLPPAGCGLLVTTRQRFVLPGMVPVDLDSLATDAAEQLLREVCPRIGDAAPRLAHLCGRLPLALRVSASMLASDDAIRVERYLERLEDQKQRLSLLHDPDDPAFDVGASLRLSYNALEPAAREVLCQLSVFPASFDLKAVLGIVRTSDAFDVEELLSMLRRRSMVDWSEDEQRYSLHDLVRVFVSTQVGDFDAVRRRHAVYFAQLVTTAKQAFDAEPGDLDAEGDASASDPVADLWDVSYTESTQIEAGWRWAQEHMGDSDADALLVSYARALGDIVDVVDHKLMDASLAVLRRDGRHGEAMSLLRELGGFYLVLNADQAMRYYEEGCAIARELHDRPTEGSFLINLGMTYGAINNSQRELECYDQALAIARETGSRWLEGSALANIGNVCAGIDHRALYAPDNVSFSVSGRGGGPILNSQQAIERYEQALDIWRAEKFPRAAAVTTAHLGMLYDRLDEVPKAFEHYEHALAAEELDRSQRSTVLGALADRYYEGHEYEKALRYAEQLLRECSGRDEPRAECDALMLLGAIAARLGNDQPALDYYLEALTHAKDLGETLAVIEILNRLGDIAGRLGSPEQALSYSEQAVAASIELNDRDTRAQLLCTLGRVHDASGRYDASAAAFQQALDLEPAPALTYAATMGIASARFNADRFGEARRAYLRGAELEPTLSGPQLCIGLTYFFQSRYDEALAAFRRALELSVSPSEKAESYTWMGNTLFEWGRDEEALAAYQHASELELGHGTDVGRMYYVLGRFDESLSEYQSANAKDPQDVDAVLGLARLYRRMRDDARFEEVVASARGLIQDNDDDHHACLAAICGHVDVAVTRLESALASGAMSLAWARRDPDFDFIRNDPRFQAVLDR